MCAEPRRCLSLIADPGRPPSRPQSQPVQAGGLLGTMNRCLTVRQCRGLFLETLETHLDGLYMIYYTIHDVHSVLNPFVGATRVVDHRTTD